MAKFDFAPYKQTTMSGVIMAGKALQISQSTMSFKEVIPDTIGDRVVIPYYEVITKYHELVERQFTQTITMTDDDFYRYKYKPNLYCYETYGTPELANALLYINNMPSVIDFTKQKLKIFSSNIISVVKELMTLNEQELKRNRIKNNID